LAPRPPPFGFPAIERKKVVAGFDGGRITSDGGVLLLGAVERQLGIADRLARLILDPRNPLYVTHSVSDILRARNWRSPAATKMATTLRNHACR
jgi:Transposase DDE domain group 1